MATITTDEAEDAIYENIANQFISKHRWYTKRLIVIEYDGSLVGFHYDEPATEIQEGQDVFESDPVPVFPVVAKQITTTTYEAAA